MKPRQFIYCTIDERKSLIVFEGTKRTDGDLVRLAISIGSILANELLVPFVVEQFQGDEASRLHFTAPVGTNLRPIIDWSRRLVDERQIDKLTVLDATECRQ